MEIKNILFVCKYNRFRSQVAEAYFKKINKNKKLSIYSAGIIKGHYPLDKTQSKIVKEFEIEINKKPESVSVDLLKKIDLIVIVANDVPASIFEPKKYKRKVIEWKIEDELNNNEKNIRKIIKKIIKKVDKLVEVLK